jgi:hypothetical protein
MRSKHSILILVSALVLASRPAHGVVLAEGSAEQKHRRDIGKQVAKYVQCLVKAAQKCEANGDEADQECFLSGNGGAGSVQGGDPNLDLADFQERIAKCDGKLDLAKKSPSDGTDPAGDYEEIGCPGDSVPGGSDQRYTDLDAFEAGVKTSAKSQIELLGSLLCGAACSADCNDDSEANRDCLEKDSKEFAKYAKGVSKCQDKCEKDYDSPDTAGGGGPTDDDEVCSVGGTGGANFDTCAGTPAAKLASKASAAGVANLKPLVDLALNDASNDLYNECDCGAGVGPCP